jgi:hypothetical protein
MKNRKALWIYVALAIGCALWFAGCEAVMEILGFGSMEEKDQNLPDSEGGENLPGSEDDENPPVIKGGEKLPDSENDENPPVTNDNYEFDPSILSVYVSASGNDETLDGTVKETPFKTLAKAYEAALADATHKRVVVLSNLIETERVMISPANKIISGSKNILIEGKYAGLKIERSVGANDSVIVIREGAKITFRNIKINGKISDSDAENANNRALHVVGFGFDTEVILEKGAVITGKMYSANDYVYETHGSGIRVWRGAKLVMKNGSAVVNCEGVNLCCGAVELYESGVLEMEEGARVSGNTGDYGGGVAIYGGSTFTMSGGEISGNTGVSGGGLYLGNNLNNVFTMTGGVIYGNEEALDSKLRNTASGEEIGAAFRKMGGGTATKQGPGEAEAIPLATTNNTIDLRSSL